MAEKKPRYGERVVPEGVAALRAWRLGNAMSQLELAELLGLKDQASVGQYETGKTPLRLKHLARLHELTGIPIEALAWPAQIEVIRSIAAAYRPIGASA